MGNIMSSDDAPVTRFHLLSRSESGLSYVREKRGGVMRVLSESELADFAEKLKMDLTIVGPELRDFHRYLADRLASIQQKRNPEACTGFPDSPNVLHKP